MVSVRACVCVCVCVYLKGNWKHANAPSVSAWLAYTFLVHVLAYACACNYV